jgi:hypothetical protein
LFDNANWFVALAEEESLHNTVGVELVVSLARTRVPDCETPVVAVIGFTDAGMTWNPVIPLVVP